MVIALTCVGNFLEVDQSFVCLQTRIFSLFRRSTAQGKQVSNVLCLLMSNVTFHSLVTKVVLLADEPLQDAMCISAQYP